MMKSQVLILKVNFEDESLEPRSWNWSEIIGCEVDCVEVLNYGCVEKVTERKDSKDD